MDSNHEAYRRLISGTDLRGIASAGFGKEITLTPEAAAAAGAAFVRALRRWQGIDHPYIAVGTDPRLSGAALKEATMRGLRSEGARCLDCGLSTTPAMFSATKAPTGADGAIMITASHLPPERNGLKFFLPTGGLNASQLREMVDDMCPVKHEFSVDKTDHNLLSEYAATLTAFIDPDGSLPLKGMRIVLDAGNGSGGFFAKVLEDTGAVVDGRYLEPDGRFPNHPANPEDAAAMASICAAVQETGADIGIIFDADCDRAALVGRGGVPINRDRLIALVAAVLLNESPGATIVTDSVTSTGLAEFIQERGGKHLRFKRGYRNVIDEAIRLQESGVDCPCAIETSGHCALRDNGYLDDGAYLTAWLLRHFGRLNAEGTDWMELTASLREPAEDAEIRIPLTRADFGADANAVLAAVEKAAIEDSTLSLAQDSAEGVRVHCPEGGWFMIRRSVHDPQLPVNIQSDNEGGAKSMAQRLLAMLEPLGELMNLESLRNFVS